MATPDFFRARLDGMVDPRHPLVELASRLPWDRIEAALAPKFAPPPTPRSINLLKVGIRQASTRWQVME